MVLGIFGELNIQAVLRDLDIGTVSMDISEPPRFDILVGVAYDYIDTEIAMQDISAMAPVDICHGLYLPLLVRLSKL